MKNEKILLIYAKVDKENFRMYMNFPAMGIYALRGGLVKKLEKDALIRTIDLNYQDGEIKEWGKYVCFSINSFNFRNSMKLIEQAKQTGAIVIVGGVHPTFVKEKMLRNKNIDYVICGEGDESLPKLIKGESLENITGLIYRNEDEIKSNAFPEISLDETFVDYYDEMFSNKKLPKDECFGKVLPYYSQKGCLWRDQSGGCFFCSAPDKRLRNKSIEKVWAEIIELCDKYNPDLIRDICDSFTGNRKWLRELARKKPDKKLPEWFSYARASEILKEGVIDDLKKIGFKYVYIGFESGDEKFKSIITKSY